MYAVIRTGGKQYKVAKNDVIKVEKLEKGDAVAQPGSVILFDQVLSFSDGNALTIGAPVVEGMKVSAEVLEQKRDDKVIVFKKKRRHNYRRFRGHRQTLVWVRIQDIGKDLKGTEGAIVKGEGAKAAAAKPAKTEQAKKPAVKAAPKAAPKADKEAAAEKAPAKKPAAKKTEGKTAAKKDSADKPKTTKKTKE